MFRKLKRKFSVLLAKKPATVVLMVILLLNIVFVLVSAAVIGALSVTGTEDMNFWQAAYYTITMILDAGCISSIVQDIGTAGVALVIICLVVIIIGMVLFTGAVIGYLTNYISNFIENANVGTHKLSLSGHTVILNWNTRASEIVNDMLYNEGKQYVVVLVSDGKEEIERELSERIADTVAQEKAAIRERSKQKRGIMRLFYRLRHTFKNNIVCIVREGDTFSTKQLNDISLNRAKSILILGNDINNSTCRYDLESRLNNQDKGNPQTIKALVQVAEITSAQASDDNQKIVVEVEDDWTLDLVKKIIEHKQVDGKCNIIPVSVNRILGRLLSQFTLMPELNLTYRELFSNKGMTFYSKPYNGTDERTFISAYLGIHTSAIPLCLMKSDNGMTAYYAAEFPKDDTKLDDISDPTYRVQLNYNYTIEKKNVIILGHNSKIKDIMAGFDNFRGEWNSDGREIMNVVIIDDKQYLERMNYYKEYPYVTKVVEAEIYDRDLICQTIEQTVLGNETDTSILVLSDDTVLNEKIDANAIANLIYVNDIIIKIKSERPDFDLGKFDVIVEILNPKHYDIIKSYSINNVVISNRYISKMITQLGEKDTLYDLYNDILSYDSADTEEFESKEIYIKKVSQYFKELPAPTTAGELIRAVYNAAVYNAPDGRSNHTIVLGYVNGQGEMTLFAGNQYKQTIELTDKDKLIVLSAH